MIRIYYFSSEEFAISNIENKRIKISKLEDLNDPFELLGIELYGKDAQQAFNARRDAVASRSGVVCFVEPSDVESLRRQA